MDKKVIRTTIPLSPAEINQYCKANAAGDNDILYEFDLRDCPLSNNHILGYLSNLKIDFIIRNAPMDFLLDYMKSPFFVGRSNLVHEHKRAIFHETVGREIIHQHRALFFSLPLFIVMSSNASQETKDLLTKEVKRYDTRYEWVGPNVAHLMNDSEFLLSQIRHQLFEFERPYLTYYFDEYIYGGERLIKFFDEDNLLMRAIGPLLTK